MPLKHDTLSGWLRTLDADALAEILRRRPDAASPPPKSMEALAERLSVTNSVYRALDALDQAALDLLQAVQTLGDGCLTGDLGRLVRAGTREKRAELDRCLTELRRRSLVWPGTGGSLRLAQPLHAGNSAGLGFGASLRDLLTPLVNTTLHRIAAAYGLRARKSKTDAVNDLITVLANADRVRAIVAGAPDEVRPLLDELVWHDPTVRSPGRLSLKERDLWGPPAQQWLMSRGLLLPADQTTATMPKEIALALRGPDHAVPIRSAPRVPRFGEHTQSGVDNSASASAMYTVDGVAQLIELCDRSPLAVLQNAPGGVGTRELRRVARILSTTEEQVRLWLTLGYEAGLLAKDLDAPPPPSPSHPWITRDPNELILPTARADAWLANAPAQRLPVLLSTWWNLPAAPTFPVHDLKSTSALLSMKDSADRELRHELLGWLAEAPPGHALLDLGELVAHRCWLRPRVHQDRDSLTTRVETLFDEAERLGVTSGWALSSWGRTLVVDPEMTAPGLAESLRDTLPSATTTARFQVDLTAVVAGSPSAGLAALLNLAADAQDRDTASVWRFSPASVRRALDTGCTAAQLTTELTEVSAGGELPQPLLYLINDVGRRHGELAVRSVGCCVIGEDPALLAEIAAHSGLTTLRPQLLAPTVLASAGSVRDTIELLRRNGYAPVQSKDGQAVVERPEVRRAPTPEQPHSIVPPPCRTVVEPEQAASLARILLSGDVPEPEPATRRNSGWSRNTAEVVRDRAERLSQAEIDLLADAIDGSTPVEIDYIEQGIGHSRRVITPKYHYGDRLHAWCHARKEDRSFRVSRIQSVCAV